MDSFDALMDDLVKAGSSPPAGFHAVPGGKHGGFTNGKRGRQRRYWYPHDADIDAAAAHHIAEGTRIANEHRGRSTPAGYPRDKDAKQEMEDHFHAGYSARDFDGVKVAPAPRKRKKKPAAATTASTSVAQAGGGEPTEHTVEQLNAYSAGTSLLSRPKKGRNRGKPVMARKNGDGTWDLSYARNDRGRLDFHVRDARGVDERMSASGVLFTDSHWGKYEPPEGAVEKIRADRMARYAPKSEKAMAPVRPELIGSFNDDDLAKSLADLASPDGGLRGADGAVHAPPENSEAPERADKQHFVVQGGNLYFDRAAEDPGVVKSKRPDGLPYRPLDDVEWGGQWDK